MSGSIDGDARGHDEHGDVQLPFLLSRHTQRRGVELSVDRVERVDRVRLEPLHELLDILRHALDRRILQRCRIEPELSECRRLGATLTCRIDMCSA